MTAGRQSGKSDFKPRIINLFGDGGRYAGQVRRAGTHEMRFSRYSFDDYMAVDPSGRSFRVDQDKLRETVEEVYGGKYAACACDSNDALLIQFFARKKGIPPMPFIINEVDGFETAGWVRNFIRLHYDEDIFQEFTAAQHNNWMYISECRGRLYPSFGIRKSNLFYIPMSTAGIEFTFPDYFKEKNTLTPPEHGRFKDKIIAVGTHNRDYATLVKAAGGAGLEIHIITNLRINPPIEAPGVFWHDSLPEADFLQAIREARCIVIPLRPDNRAAGQMGCAIPMKWGKIVVAARCEATRDHIIHGETGFLYRPGSARELRKLLLHVDASPDVLLQIADNTRKREQELSKTAQNSIRRLLKKIGTQ